MKVWPGDVPPSREVLKDAKAGDASTASVLHATVHLGAHADAPSHCGPNALSIDEVDVERFIGRCQVIRIDAACREDISPAAVKTPVIAQRVLFATGTYTDPTQFNDDFAALSPGLIAWLHERGVKLVGIDTPSIDLFSSKDMPVHRAVLEHDMAVLEGLALESVPEGVYELIALPLKLVGFDASPVRAILRELEPHATRR